MRRTVYGTSVKRCVKKIKQGSDVGVVVWFSLVITVAIMRLIFGEYAYGTIALIMVVHVRVWIYHRVSCLGFVYWKRN